ncbi:UvrY/SirA/GacA family response regulator transcription factor [Oceaniserpentilla sp. 4NH20-0058]|uniref:UvrY/SirA/GacA family response regulator transcription factor n=1 Tax=Oceaniserpentilla sp. 4NH20-0058 TaxID=3127660 RepID=UPI003108BE6D
MIRVLVVDDHDLVRMGIVSLLSSSDKIEVIAQASSGEEAIDLAKTHEPDVILMDIRMPGMGGLEATHKLIRLNPDVKVIAVTACAEDPFASRLLQAGAAGYMTKGSTTEEMIMAVLKVKSGQRYISPEIAQRMALKPFATQEEACPFDVLSDREMQISILIVNCSKVQEISDQLFLSPKTVNTYRYRIFEKLNINSDVELTRLAIRHGIIDTESIN